MNENPNRHPLDVSASEADLLAAALQNFVGVCEAMGNTKASVTAFVLRGRVLAHAAAIRRLSPEISQFDEEKRAGYRRGRR